MQQSADTRGHGELGAASMEYAILIAAIALAVIGSVAVLGAQVLRLFQSVPPL